MGNKYSNYSIIRVTPTLDTDQYAQGDVLFTATEIPLAVRGDAGCSKIICGWSLNQGIGSADDIDLYFTEANTALGTINATANISDANLEAIGLCGIGHIDASTGATSQLDNAEIHPILHKGTGVGSPMNMLIQAAAGSESVYVQGVLTSNTTPTFAADDLDLIFHIQYK